MLFAPSRFTVRGEPTSTGYRDINISVEFEGHVCEIQIQLAALLEIKHDQTPAYELIRSLDLEDDVEDGTTMVDLAAACSAGMRVALGALRFFVASFGSLVSALYITFGVLYDEEATRWMGAVGVWGESNLLIHDAARLLRHVTHVLTHTH